MHPRTMKKSTDVKWTLESKGLDSNPGLRNIKIYPEEDQCSLERNLRPIFEPNDEPISYESGWVACNSTEKETTCDKGKILMSLNTCLERI